MSTYAPPDKILSIFNPSDWQYAEDTVMTQALADERYLKLTGGNESGAVNFGSTIAVTGTSTFTGNSTFSNNLSANTATFSGNVAFDANTLFVDSVNNAVGCGYEPSSIGSTYHLLVGSKGIFNNGAYTGGGNINILN